MKKTLIMGSSIFTLFILWQIVYMVVNHPLLVPSIGSVFTALIGILTHLDSIEVIGFTLLRLFLSIALSGVLGISIGILAGLNQKLSLFIKPYVTILRTIPVISIVVILLIIFGYAYTPFIITFLMVFPIIFQSVHQGITHIDHELIDVYRLEEKHLFLAIRILYFPMVKNHIILGLLQSFGLGLKVLVMAEYLAQTRISIGNSIYLSKINLQYDHVFAWTLILILIATFLEFAIKKYEQKKQ
jgi:NitT/TauT family transport system permease protein